MNPYFSIILPIYNVESCLERCIHSILAQDFLDYEIILVDDGSTDNSSKICDDYAAKYAQISVIHKVNGGLSSARNAGVALAKGEYIWWVDSDDWIKEGALRLLHQVTTEQKPEIVKFNHIRVTQDDYTEVISNANPGLYPKLEGIDELHQQAFLKPTDYVLSAWSHLYRREFLEKQNLSFVSERQIGSEDYLFNLSALLVAKRIFVVRESLYFYELRLGSLTQRYKENLPQRYTKLYLLLKDFFCKAGKLADYECLINTFYVWHLLHGTCIPNEYFVTQDHSLADGRVKVAAFLKLLEFQKAVRLVAMSHFTWKAKVQICAMRMRMEPIFYWLYVVKPQIKRRLKK